MGWQQQAATPIEHTVWPGLGEHEQAMMRSQRGPLVSTPFTCFPTSRMTRIDPLHFAPLLRLPISAVAGVAVYSTPLTTTEQLARTAGVLGRRGCSRVGSKSLPRGRARVRSNVIWRWWQMAFPCMEERRLQSTRPWCPSTGMGRRAETARTDGKALDEARKRKERTYPELAGEGGRARLVVLGAEVGGRWSQKTVDFLSSLAWIKVRDLPEELQKDARRPWFRRWCVVLGCAAVKAFAMSLLDSPCAVPMV